METKDAVQKIVKELKNDPEYYETWKANIAMAFYDASGRNNNHLENARKAADIFLNNLISS